MSIFKKITDDYGGFELLLKKIGEEPLKMFCDRTYQHYCRKYSDASYLTNVEWVLRHFTSSKKITLSALFFTQAQYIVERNLKNLSFYSLYYCLFNAYSSNTLLLPYLDIDKVKNISHSAIFKHIENYFVKFQIYNTDEIELLNDLRLTREAYSYRLPLGGTFVREGEKLHVENLFAALEDILPFSLQMSDLLSYLSHYAWGKKVGRAIDEYDEYQEEVDDLFFSLISQEDHLGNHYLIDDDDYRRQGYALLKWKTPFPIRWFIIEKMCEDLECGWEQPDDEGYDINEVRHFLSNTLSTF